MDDIKMLPNHQAFLDRFIYACQNDDRIVAVFLGGSYAIKAADEHSDIDLFVILTDEDYEDFLPDQVAFLHLFGEPVFMESFDLPNFSFFIYSDGTEGHVYFGHEGQFECLHTGPYTVLLDKKDILAGVVFPGCKPGPEEQTEKLRRLLFYFWHEVSHFTTGLARGQLWWAQGQLESMRGMCISLVRLQNDFFDHEAGSEPYFKIERDVPVEQLSVLQGTFGPMEKYTLYRAALIIVEFFKEKAVPLANSHGIPYPDVLEWIMVNRLAKLRLN